MLCNIVGSALMAIVLDPTLVGVFAAAPLDESGFADPSVVIILSDTPELGIVLRVQRF